MVCHLPALPDLSGTTFLPYYVLTTIAFSQFLEYTIFFPRLCCLLLFSVKINEVYFQSINNPAFTKEKL